MKLLESTKPRTRKIFNWRTVKRDFRIPITSDGPLTVKANIAQRLVSNELGIQKGVPPVTFNRAVPEHLAIVNGQPNIVTEYGQNLLPTQFALHPKTILHETQTQLNYLRPKSIPSLVRKLHITPRQFIERVNEGSMVSLVVKAVIQKSKIELNDDQLNNLTNKVLINYKAGR